MLFRSLRKRFVEGVKATVALQIGELKEELSEYQKREQEYLQKIVLLEENVRNNNARPESLKVLEENVRNNNVVFFSK